jgi:hypothetical protein
MDKTLHKPLAPASDKRFFGGPNRLFECLERPGEDIGVPQTTSPMGKSEFSMGRCQGHIMSCFEQPLSSRDGHQSAAYHDHHGDTSMDNASTGQLGRQ